jgi:tripartite-type tricarboxylate transporter receptor subunit TctC
VPAATCSWREPRGGAVAPRPARAQSYPARPVRVIVTTGPGGQGDTTARLIAEAHRKPRPAVLRREHSGRGRQHRPRHRRARAAGRPHHPAAGGSFVANPSLMPASPTIRTRISPRSRWSARPRTCSRCILRCQRIASRNWWRWRRPIPAR